MLHCEALRLFKGCDDKHAVNLKVRLSGPDFYGDLVYKLKKIVGSNNFSAQFIKIIPIIKRLAITLMYCNKLHAL